MIAPGSTVDERLDPYKTNEPPIVVGPFSWGAGETLKFLVRGRNVVRIGPKWERRYEQRWARRIRRRRKQRRGWA